MKKGLVSANFKVSFISALSEVASALNDFKPSVLVHDWAAADETQTRRFHLNFGKSSQATDLMRVLVVPEVTSKILAFASDAGIEKVVSLANASLKLGQEIEMTKAAEGASEVVKTLREIVHSEGTYSQKDVDQKISGLYEKFPHDQRVKLEFGSLKLRTDGVGLALQLASEVLNSEPHNLRAINLKARSLMKQGQFDEALESLGAAHVLSPGNPDRLIMMGDACYGKGDLDKAFEFYEEAAIPGSANEADAKKGMAQIRVDQGKIEDALDFLKNGVSEDEAAGFFNNAAVIAVREGKPEKALKLYESALGALKTNKLKPLIYFNIAHAHRRLGKADLAESFLKKALKVDPNYEKAKQSLEQLKKG